MKRYLVTIAMLMLMTNFSSSQAQTQALRDLADAHHLLMGSAVAIPPLRSEPLYANTLAREYNGVTPENVMKWDATEPQQGVFNFTDGDFLVDFAQSHDMRVRGHTLVWHQQLPSWLNSGTFTPAQLTDILHNHITNVVSHYRGRVYAWDVVNEAIDDNRGDLRKTIWLNGIGADYIADAFRWAHEADPDALLFYNDYGAEGANQKADAVYKLVSGLVSQGVPINGVGMQMHVGIGVPPNAAAVAANIARINALGLQVQITEMDVKLQDGSGDETARLQAQAQVYHDMLTVCLQATNCTGFVTWGFTDKYSWIPSFTHHDDAALPFDVNYQPKPAYAALQQAFIEHPPAATPSP
ncbi:MAG TPA: endo-1,4-beta-xylanase [Phototrophicaceae bacterium]|nr:endo-1,4-beta-xylanase [Phototrophicaceae bacterium]